MKIRKISVCFFVLVGCITNLHSKQEATVTFEQIAELIQKEYDPSKPSTTKPALKLAYENFIEELRHSDNNALAQKIGGLDRDTLICILRQSNGTTFNHNYWKVAGLHGVQVFIGNMLGVYLLNCGDPDRVVTDSILGGLIFGLLFRAGSWPKLGPKDILDFECFMVVVSILCVIILPPDSLRLRAKNKEGEVLILLIIITYFLGKRWYMQANLDKLLRELYVCENDTDLNEIKALYSDKLVKFLKRFAEAKAT